jgi:hypothetical protein
MFQLAFCFLGILTVLYGSPVSLIRTTGKLYLETMDFIQRIEGLTDRSQADVNALVVMDPQLRYCMDLFSDMREGFPVSSREFQTVFEVADNIFAVLMGISEDSKKFDLLEPFTAQWKSVLDSASGLVPPEMSNAEIHLKEQILWMKRTQTLFQETERALDVPLEDEFQGPLRETLTLLSAHKHIVERHARFTCIGDLRRAKNPPQLLSEFQKSVAYVVSAVKRLLGAFPEPVASDPSSRKRFYELLVRIGQKWVDIGARVTCLAAKLRLDSSKSIGQRKGLITTEEQLVELAPICETPKSSTTTTRATDSEDVRTTTQGLEEECAGEFFVEFENTESFDAVLLDISNHPPHPSVQSGKGNESVLPEQEIGVLFRKLLEVLETAIRKRGLLPALVESRFKIVVSQMQSQKNIFIAFEKKQSFEQPSRDELSKSVAYVRSFLQNVFGAFRKPEKKGALRNLYTALVEMQDQWNDLHARIEEQKRENQGVLTTASPTQTEEMSSVDPPKSRKKKKRNRKPSAPTETITSTTTVPTTTTVFEEKSGEWGTVRKASSVTKKATAIPIHTVKADTAPTTGKPTSPSSTQSFTIKMSTVKPTRATTVKKVSPPTTLNRLKPTRALTTEMTTVKPALSSSTITSVKPTRATTVKEDLLPTTLTTLNRLKPTRALKADMTTVKPALSSSTITSVKPTRATTVKESPPPTTLTTLNRLKPTRALTTVKPTLSSSTITSVKPTRTTTVKQDPLPTTSTTARPSSTRSLTGEMTTVKPTLSSSTITSVKPTLRSMPTVDPTSMPPTTMVSSPIPITTLTTGTTALTTGSLMMNSESTTVWTMSNVTNESSMGFIGDPVPPASWPMPYVQRFDPYASLPLRRLCGLLDQSAFKFGGIARVCDDVVRFSPDDRMRLQAKSVRDQLETAQSIVSNIRMSAASLLHSLIPTHYPFR